MDNKNPTIKIESNNEGTNEKSSSIDISESTPVSKNSFESTDNPKATAENTDKLPPNPKKPLKPPKLEDKPFGEFIRNHFIPGIKSSIQEKGTLIKDIKLIEGNRPVVGGNCWMVVCEISEQRRFWLCFNKEIITSDKTILLAESNSEPSIVESFLIDEKKTTLALLISRVLQRLNGQKWIGAN